MPAKKTVKNKQSNTTIKAKGDKQENHLLPFPELECPKCEHTKIHTYKTLQIIEEGKSCKKRYHRCCKCQYNFQTKSKLR